MKLKSSVAVACFLPGWAKDLSAILYSYKLLRLTKIILNSDSDAAIFDSIIDGSGN